MHASLNSCGHSVHSLCKMRLFQGAQLLAVLLVLCNLSVLAAGKTNASILNTIFVLNFMWSINVSVMD